MWLRHLPFSMLFKLSDILCTMLQQAISSLSKMSADLSQSEEKDKIAAATQHSDPEPMEVPGDHKMETNIAPPAGSEDETSNIAPPVGSEDEMSNIAPPAGSVDETSNIAPPAASEDEMSTTERMHVQPVAPGFKCSLYLNIFLSSLECYSIDGSVL